MPPKRFQPPRSAAAKKVSSDKQRMGEIPSADSWTMDGLVEQSRAAAARSSTSEHAVAAASNTGSSPRPGEAPAVPLSTTATRPIAVTWDELVYGPSVVLGEDYLTTDSPPWSEQANTHVLLPHDVEDHATWVTPLQRSEQEEILALIGGRVLSSPYTESFPPPLVHFYRQKVTLHSHDQRLLQEL